MEGQIKDHPSVVSTTQFARVGERLRWLDPTYGWQEYVFIQATEALPAYRTCMWDSGSSLTASLATAARPAIFLAGVVQNALAITQYGWALRKGDGLGQADAAVTIHTRLAVATASASGRLDDTAAGNTDAYISSVFAVAVAAAAAAGDNFRVRVALP